MCVQVPILVGSPKVQEHPCAHALNGPPSRKPWSMDVTKEHIYIHQIPASAV
jgi:hypothetical protein